jgi:tRNA dimethylallyltransferase
LEVVRSTGQTLAHWQQRLEGGIGDRITLAPLVLLPDRDWLYERCDRRFGLMVEQGALDEVERLLARGLDSDLPVMRAIGVSSLAKFLRREADLTRPSPMERRPRAIMRNANIHGSGTSRRPIGYAKQTNFAPEKHFDILFHD